jgi:hypothetical protein
MCDVVWCVMSGGVRAAQGAANTRQHAVHCWGAQGVQIGQLSYTGSSTPAAPAPRAPCCAGHTTSSRCLQARAVSPHTHTATHPPPHLCRCRRRLLPGQTRRHTARCRTRRREACPSHQAGDTPRRRQWVGEGGEGRGRGSARARATGVQDKRRATPAASASRRSQAAPCSPLTPHSLTWYPNCAPGGMGALRPGTLRLGYEGGGP